MALSKERKVLLVLLGSAGLILVVDQLLLGPPQRASAAASAPLAEPPAAPQAPSTTDAEAPTPDDGQALDLSDWNERLAKIDAEVGGGRAGVDPFSAPRPSEDTPDGVISPQQFQSKYALSAVMTGGDRGIAMVNGKAIRVGEEIAGYRLVRVDARSAEFHADGVVVLLELPVQGIGGS